MQNQLSLFHFFWLHNLPIYIQNRKHEKKMLVEFQKDEKRRRIHGIVMSQLKAMELS